jgi:energy-coupling factor transport system permease protein
MRKSLNPTILAFLLIGIGVQVAFTRSVIANLVVSLVSLGYLLMVRISAKRLLLLFVVAIPLALGTGWSFMAFGQGDKWHLALIYATRLFAYLFLGGTLTLTTSPKQLIVSLMVQVKLSSTFGYGLLAAFNLLPRVRRQVGIIRYAAQIRGITYHWWLPQIYFKAILSALHWSTDLAEAMTSHGFSEGFPRTQVEADALPLWQWGFLGVTLISYAFLAFVCQPW